MQTAKIMCENKILKKSVRIYVLFILTFVTVSIVLLHYNLPVFEKLSLTSFVMDRNPKGPPKTKKVVFDKSLFVTMMSTSNKTNFVILIQRFDEVMQKCGIRYMLASGTLLGSYRHHGFIPWDDGFRVIVNWNDRTWMHACFRKWEPDFLLIKARYRSKFFSKDGLQLKTHRKWRWPYIDVTFYVRNKYLLVDISITDGKHYVYPKALVFPLEMRPFEGMRLPSPKDAFGILVWNYGFTRFCETMGYSRLKEIDKEDIHRAPCLVLRSKFAFVKHSWCTKNSKMEEKLIKDGKLLHTLYSNEPRYAQTEMFGLVLKKTKFPLPRSLQQLMENGTESEEDIESVHEMVKTEGIEIEEDEE